MLTQCEAHALLAIAERGIEAGVQDWTADELAELRSGLEKLASQSARYVVAELDGVLAVAA